MMHAHHRRALAVVTLAAVLDVTLGAAFGAADHIGCWNGLYFATSIATTAGNSPFFPHGWQAYTLAVLMHVTVIPLWLAAFSLFTSGLTSSRVAASEDRVKRHVEDRLHAHARGGAEAAERITALGERVDGLAGAVRDVLAARALLPQEPGSAGTARQRPGT